ncbi:MAG TPA: DUF5808 domain-containing protein [Virgibacillus sp.]|nr:DUF5808 domain-containing protein [Virgibacillus sp.]
MNTMIVLLVSLFIPIFITMMFIPYWTRRTESFGVSIPEDEYHSVSLKKMRKHYVWTTLGLSFFMMISFVIFGMATTSEDFIGIVFSIMVSLYIIASFIIYLVFHRQMKRLKEKQNWAASKTEQLVIDTAFREEKLNYSNWWFIIPFLIAIGSAMLSFRYYHLIPDQIPMQYSLTGEVTNWADKSYRTILIFPIIQVYMTLLFIFINTVIGKSKQQISVIDPDQSIRKNKVFRRRWSLFIIISGIAMILLFSLVQLSFVFPINAYLLWIIPSALTLLMIISTIILSFTTGQGGARIQSSTDKTGSIIERDDDQHWKLGQFYFNKNDPSIFLEKRFGIGWTNNWAHPLSWIIIIGLIGLAAGIPLLLMI